MSLTKKVRIILYTTVLALVLLCAAGIITVLPAHAATPAKVTQLSNVTAGDAQASYIYFNATFDQDLVDASVYGSTGLIHINRTASEGNTGNVSGLSEYIREFKLNGMTIGEYMEQTANPDCIMVHLNVGKNVLTFAITSSVISAMGEAILFEIPQSERFEAFSRIANNGYDGLAGDECSGVWLNYSEGLSVEEVLLPETGGDVCFIIRFDRPLIAKENLLNGTSLQYMQRHHYSWPGAAVDTSVDYNGDISTPKSAKWLTAQMGLFARTSVLINGKSLYQYQLEGRDSGIGDWINAFGIEIQSEAEGGLNSLRVTFVANNNSEGNRASVLSGSALKAGTLLTIRSTFRSAEGVAVGDKDFDFVFDGEAMRRVYVADAYDDFKYSLSEAISRTDAGNTVYVNDGSYGDLTFEKEITLQGSGAGTVFNSVTGKNLVINAYDFSANRFNYTIDDGVARSVRLKNATIGQLNCTYNASLALLQENCIVREENKQDTRPFAADNGEIYLGAQKAVFPVSLQDHSVLTLTIDGTQVDTFSVADGYLTVAGSSVASLEAGEHACVLETSGGDLNFSLFVKEPEYFGIESIDSIAYDEAGNQYISILFEKPIADGPWVHINLDKAGMLAQNSSMTEMQAEDIVATLRHAALNKIKIDGVSAATIIADKQDPNGVMIHVREYQGQYRQLDFVISGAGSPTYNFAFNSMRAPVLEIVSTEEDPFLTQDYNTVAPCLYINNGIGGGGTASSDPIAGWACNMWFSAKADLTVTSVGEFAYNPDGSITFRIHFDNPISPQAVNYLQRHASGWPGAGVDGSINYELTGVDAVGGADWLMQQMVYYIKSGILINGKSLYDYQLSSKNNYYGEDGSVLDAAYQDYLNLYHIEVAEGELTTLRITLNLQQSEASKRWDAEDRASLLDAEDRLIPGTELVITRAFRGGNGSSVAADTLFVFDGNSFVKAVTVSDTVLYAGNTNRETVELALQEIADGGLIYLNKAGTETLNVAKNIVLAGCKENGSLGTINVTDASVTLIGITVETMNMTVEDGKTYTVALYASKITGQYKQIANTDVINRFVDSVIENTVVADSRKPVLISEESIAFGKTNSKEDVLVPVHVYTGWTMEAQEYFRFENGNIVIDHTYLAGLKEGAYTFDLVFENVALGEEGSAKVSVTVNVVADSTPEVKEDCDLTFDRANAVDLLILIKEDCLKLEEGENYTVVDGATAKVSKEYLNGLALGEHTFVLNFINDVTLTVTITVTDTRAPSVALSEMQFEVSAPADVKFTMNLYSASFVGLQREGTEVDASSYTFADGILTIKADYLKTLDAGVAQFTAITSSNEILLKVNVVKAENESTKGGCSSSAGGVSVLFALVACGTALCFVKKKSR